MSVEDLHIGSHSSRTETSVTSDAPYLLDVVVTPFDLEAVPPSHDPHLGSRTEHHSACAGFRCETQLTPPGGLTIASGRCSSQSAYIPAPM